MADFTDWQVSKGVGVDPANAGAENGVSLANADGSPIGTGVGSVTIGDGLNIIVIDSGVWADEGTFVENDWITFDPGAVNERRRIILVSGGSMQVDVSTLGNLSELSGKDVIIGGALPTIQQAATLVTTDHVNGDDKPVAINIGPGTYVETLTTANLGNVSKPITFEGYAINPHDIDWTTSESRSIIAPGSGITASLVHGWNRFFNMDFRSVNNRGVSWEAGSSRTSFFNCRMSSQSGDGGFAGNNAHWVNLYRCIFEDCGGNGLSGRFGSFGTIIGCIFRNNGGFGVTGGQTGIIQDCLIVGNTGVGISDWASVFLSKISGCTIADNGGDGIDFGTETDLYFSSIESNIIAHNGGYGINSTAAADAYYLPLLDYNCFHDNNGGGTGIDINSKIVDESEANVTTAPFTGANKAAREANFYTTTDDVKAAGFGLFADVNYESFADIGIQHEDAGGGGGGGVLTSLVVQG